MANIAELLKKIAAEIAAHNSLAKQQAAGVVEAGLGKLTSGEIKPIMEIPPAAISYDWVPPSHVTEKQLQNGQLGCLTRGLGSTMGQLSCGFRILRLANT